MKQDEIIEMAKQAGWKDMKDYDSEMNESFFIGKFTDLKTFAKLVAEHEREKYKWDIHSCSPTCNRYVCVAKREAVLAEREACAEVCKKHADFYAGLEPSPIAQSAWAACVDNLDTIRARGQA